MPGHSVSVLWRLKTQVLAAFLITNTNSNLLSLDVSKTVLPLLLHLTSYVRFLCPQAVRVKDCIVASFRASLKEMLWRTKPNYLVPLLLHPCSYAPLVSWKGCDGQAVLIMPAFLCWPTPSFFNYPYQRDTRARGDRKGQCAIPVESQEQTPAVLLTWLCWCVIKCKMQEGGRQFVNKYVNEAELMSFWHAGGITDCKPRAQHISEGRRQLIKPPLCFILLLFSRNS